MGLDEPELLADIMRNPGKKSAVSPKAAIISIAVRVRCMFNSPRRPTDQRCNHARKRTPFAIGAWADYGAMIRVC